MATQLRIKCALLVAASASTACAPRPATFGARQAARSSPHVAEFCSHELTEAPAELFPQTVAAASQLIETYCATTYPLWVAHKFPPYPHGGPPAFQEAATSSGKYLWISSDPHTPPATLTAYALSSRRIVYAQRGPSDSYGAFPCETEVYGQAPTPLPTYEDSSDACLEGNKLRTLTTP